MAEETIHWPVCVFLLLFLPPFPSRLNNCRNPKHPRRRRRSEGLAERVKEGGKKQGVKFIKEVGKRGRDVRSGQRSETGAKRKWLWKRERGGAAGSAGWQLEKVVRPKTNLCHLRCRINQPSSVTATGGGWEERPPWVTRTLWRKAGSRNEVRMLLNPARSLITSFYQKSLPVFHPGVNLAVTQQLWKKVK